MQALAQVQGYVIQILGLSADSSHSLQIGLLIFQLERQGRRQVIAESR